MCKQKMCEKHIKTCKNGQQFEQHNHEKIGSKSLKITQHEKMSKESVRIFFLLWEGPLRFPPSFPLLLPNQYFPPGGSRQAQYYCSRRKHDIGKRYLTMANIMDPYDVDIKVITTMSGPNQTTRTSVEHSLLPGQPGLLHAAVWRLRGGSQV